MEWQRFCNPVVVILNDAYRFVKLVGSLTSRKVPMIFCHTGYVSLNFTVSRVLSRAPVSRHLFSTVKGNHPRVLSDLTGKEWNRREWDHYDILDTFLCWYKSRNPLHRAATRSPAVSESPVRRMKHGKLPGVAVPKELFDVVKIPDNAH